MGEDGNMDWNCNMNQRSIALVSAAIYQEIE